ncbi:MAG: cupin domain-containing protein [Cytophagaceae bacterium]
MENLAAKLNFYKEKPSSETLLTGVSKVVMLGISAGNELKAHTSPVDAILSVVSGKGGFEYENKNTLLSPGMVIKIPADLIHSVKATEDLKFLLIR